LKRITKGGGGGKRGQGSTGQSGSNSGENGQGSIQSSGEEGGSEEE